MTAYIQSFFAFCICFHVFLCFSFLLLCVSMCVLFYSMDLRGVIQNSNKARKED